MDRGFWEPDGDYYPVRKFPEARPCHGREEIARFFTEYRATWHYRFVVEDARAITDDRVLVRGRISAEGTASGVTLEGDLYHCFWLRHGRFIRVEDHLTAKGALHALGLSGEAFEAAGISEQAMSQENVQIVRKVAEIWNVAGWQGVADRGLLHPEIEYHDDRRWPEARSVVGTADLVKRFDEVLEVLGEASRVEVEQVLDAGGDQVVSIFRFGGVARASGIHHDYRWGYVWRFQDRQIVYMQAYLDPKEALEAAGLSEQAMSQENVETVRRGYEHLSRTGEFPWELIDPEVEVHDPPLGPDSEVRHGHEGLRAGLASVEESFDNLTFEAEEIYDAGDDVVVFVRMHGRGKGSGVELEVPVAHLCTLRDGKLVRIRVLLRDEAMEAAGLRE